MMLAGHWSTGAGGITPGMIVLVAVPYLLIGLSAAWLWHNLRR